MKIKIPSFYPVVVIAMVFAGAVQAAPNAKKSKSENQPAGISPTPVQAAPKAKKIKQPKHQLAFAQADDGDGFLTVFEFAKTQGPGTPLVEIRRRFLPIDTSGAFEVVLDPVTGEPAVDPATGQPVLGNPVSDGLISLAEWEAYVAGKKKLKSTLSRFELADFNGDGQLEPVEFGYLFSPMVKAENTLIEFENIDIDDDGFISEEEFYASYYSL